MPTEPIACTACSRKFSPKFAKCPFCNAPSRAQPAASRCAECGREHDADLTACPFCHPELVAARKPPPPPVDPKALGLLVQAAGAADDLDGGTSWLTRKVVLGSLIATGVGLVSALGLARHYDRLGPDLIGTVARSIGVLCLVSMGIWFRQIAFRGPAMSLQRIGAIVILQAVIALPASLIAYTLALILNSWTASDPVDVPCSIASFQGSLAQVACRVPNGGSVSGSVHAAPLRERLAGSMAFVAPMREGGLSAWLLDVESARPPSPEGIVLPGAEGEPPLILAPGVAFPGVDDRDLPRRVRLGAPPSPTSDGE